MADSGPPSALGRLWQRGTSGWTGDWTVQLEDGKHAVSVVLRMGVTGNRLTVSADGQKIDSALIFAYLGEIRRFTWHEHRFGLRGQGFRLVRRARALHRRKRARPGRVHSVNHNAGSSGRDVAKCRSTDKS